MAKKIYRKNYSTKKRGGLFGSSAEAAPPVNRTCNGTGANFAGASPSAQPVVVPSAQPPSDGVAELEATGSQMERQETEGASSLVNASISSSANELSTPPAQPSTITSPTSVLKGGYKSRRKSKRNKKCKSKRNKKCKSRRK
jgi:hypothetical protein